MTTEERRAWYNNPFKEDNRKYVKVMNNTNFTSCQLCKDSTGCTEECLINGGQPVQYSPPKQAPQLGWICPRCGSGMSPYTSKCECATKVQSPYLGKINI